MTKKILLQAGFWISIFVINLALVPDDDHVSRTLLFETICLAAYAFVFYLNILYLFPKYYEDSKYKYILAGVVIVFLMFLVIYTINKLIFWNPFRRHHNSWFEMFFSFRYLLWLSFIYYLLEHHGDQPGASSICAPPSA